MNQFLIKKTGEKQPQQVDGDVGNGAFGRKILAIQVVDAPGAGVLGDELVGQLSDGRLHGRSIQQERGEGKSTSKRLIP